MTMTDSRILAAGTMAIILAMVRSIPVIAPLIERCLDRR